METEGSRIKVNHRDDGDPRALYYWPYREKYEEIRGILVSGQIIPGDLDIMYAGNNTLLPISFDLRKVDREKLGEGLLNLPGKSAHIAFSKDINVICGALFDRKCRRTDHAYVLKAEELLDLNFFPVYAPTQNTPLHVRVVHKTHKENPDAKDIPYKEKIALAELLQKHKIA